MLWVYAGFFFLASIFFLPDSLGSKPGIIFVALWYFTTGKKQINYLKESGIEYQRKSWTKPLLTGSASAAIFVGIIFTYAFATSPSTEEIIEKESVSLVTQVLQQQLGVTVSCTRVHIRKKAAPNIYLAYAYISDGDKLDINIEIKGEQILLTIPKQLIKSIVDKD